MKKTIGIDLWGNPIDEEEEAYQLPSGFVSKIDAPHGKGFHVSKIKILNFKSIKDMEIELPRIGILTGPNNSGKSTILQAVSLGFECLARNVDFNKWTIKKSGSSISEISSVPVNHPKNLWFNNQWQKPHAERITIVIKIEFTNGSYFVSYIKYIYGFLNLNVREYSDDLKDPTILRDLVNSSPLLIPGIPQVLRHEPPLLPAVFRAYISQGSHSQVLRNVLMELKDNQRYSIIEKAIHHHFDLKLKEIDFDPRSNLEIRIPYEERKNEFELISGGSGFHQIIQLVSLLTWSNSSIILLDEPDSHLHTSLQKKLYMFLDDLSRELNLQLLISTHSRDFLSASPVHSIIPVDVKSKILRPMKSIDHLLTEFKRQGTFSNLDLACLYNSKKCIFVEGDSDIDILMPFAERLGSKVFSGKDHSIIFPFKGKEKIWMIPELVDILEKMVGTKINWFIIRDRDSLASDMLKKFADKLNKSGINNFHIWKRYEIENYLLDSLPIVRIINSFNNNNISVDEIESIILDYCNETLKEQFPQIVSENQNIFKKFFGLDNYQTEGARIAQEYIEMCKASKEKLLAIVPGSKILSKLFNFIQENYHVNMRPVDIAREMKNDEIDNEIKMLFQKLS